MTSSETREYNSPLRAAQAEQTRTLILDTLGELVAEDGFDGVSVKAVAERSGVAERTIYRHFPDRNALQDALIERLSKAHGWTDRMTESMRDLDAFPEALERAYVHFDQEADSTRIAAKVLAASSRSAPSSLERAAALQRMVDTGLPDVAADDRRVLAGVLHVLASTRTWLRLGDDFGVTGAEAGRFLRWLTTRTIEEIRREGGIPAG